MSAKHTPGKWTVENPEGYGDQLNVISDYPAGHGTLIASMNMMDRHVYRMPEDVAATARLIAAAPDLAFSLACLSTAILRYERGLEGGLSEATKLADKARALLARIENGG